MREICGRGRLNARRLALVALTLLLPCVDTSSQQPVKLDQDAKHATKEIKPDGDKSAPHPTFTLSVKTKPILNLTLKAEKAKLSEVAAELSTKLKTPVLVGPTLQKELISIEFSQLTLEPALQLMAPQVYVDYEINTGSSSPRALGIFFYDTNQGEPPLTAVIAGSSQSLLIEGNTEDGVEPTTEEEQKKLEEQPLRILFQSNTLSIKAKKQPLALVLLKIGEELGIPVDIQYEATEMVDIEISKLSVEDAVRQLSPNIRLFIRVDLTRSERRAMRLVLPEPAKTTQED